MYCHKTIVQNQVSWTSLNLWVSIQHVKTTRAHESEDKQWETVHIFINKTTYRFLNACWHTTTKLSTNISSYMNDNSCIQCGEIPRHNIAHNFLCSVLVQRTTVTITVSHFHHIAHRATVIQLCHTGFSAANFHEFNLNFSCIAFVLAELPNTNINMYTITL